MNETELVRDCLDMLREYGIFAWRNNTGGCKTDSGRLIRFGRVGSADIIGILEGLFLAIECKVGRNRLSGEQVDFMNEVMRSGGIYWVIRDVDDLEAKLENWYEENKK